MKTIARAVRTGQGILLGTFVVLLLWSPVLASSPGGGQGRGPGQSAGQLSAADALSALQMSVGLRPADTHVDLDKDEAITSNDSRLILLCVVGKCPPEIVAEQNREQCLEYRGQAEELAAQRRWPEVAALIEKARSAPLSCAEEDFASLREQVRGAENLCREHRARIKEGEALCSRKDWEACREHLAPALKGVEDCPELAEGAVRARQLLAQAEAELARRQGACTARVRQVTDAAGQCNAKDYARCKETLTKALDNAEKDCGADKKAVFDNARKLLAQAEAELAKAAKAKEEQAKAAKAKEEQAKAAKAKEEQLRKEQARKEQEQKARCDELFNQAYAKGEKNDSQGAIALYRKLLEHCPDYCVAMNNIGSGYNKLGQPEKAKPWFEKAAQCDPKHELYRNNLAKVQQRKLCDDLWNQAYAKGEKNDPQGAIALYRKLLEHCPTYCGAMNNIGVQYLDKLGQPEKAKTWYEKAVQCNPKDELYRNNLAAAQKRLQQKTPETSPKTSKEKCDELWNQARARSQQNDPQGAIALYRKLLEHCPTYCGAMNNIGAQYLDKLGQPEKAKPWFEKAAQCNPKDELYRKNLAKVRKQPQQKTPAPGGKFDGTYRGLWYFGDNPNQSAHNNRITLQVRGKGFTLTLVDTVTGKVTTTAKGTIDNSGKLSVNFGYGQGWGTFSGNRAKGGWTATYDGKGYRGHWYADKGK